MRYFLIGEKLSHSYSEIIHKYNGFDYSLKEIKKDNLLDFIKEKNYSGLNVTIPYKKDVMPALDYIDKTALEIGAVNTIKNDNGRLLGYNTDIFGMEYMANRAKIDLKDKNVLILGSGGTKNTAQYLAEKSGAKSISFVSRTGEVNYENCYNLTSTNVIINATPSGMYPNNYTTPVDLSRFDNLEGVLDCVYNPMKTCLILQAEELSIKASGGLAMLVAQAVKSEEIWLGKTCDSSRIEEIIKEIERQKGNIVLTGMPGSGKSTVARVLSERTGKRVIDTDSEIEKKAGMKIPEIFSKFGEKYFRDIESAVIKEVSINSGIIIATGGGSVLRKENRNALKQNGLICYLERDIEKLISDGRPLSQKQGVKKLFEDRKEIYYSFADAIINCNGEIMSAVEDILAL